MKTLIVGLIITLMNFSSLECAAQASQLPKEMPEEVAIRFNENGGMTPAGTSINISNQTISVEEKKADETSPRKWSAKIEKSEQENLYQTFVENKFDTLKNDERKNIVYDAGSEGIFLDLGNGAYYNKSYGANQPMSGSNLKRYRIIAKAIDDLRARYEGKPSINADANFVVLNFDAEKHQYIFKDAKETSLSDDETTQAKEIIKRAVGEYNSIQKNKQRSIKFDGYKFQLIPVISKNGAKEIWVNGFCSEFENWRTAIILVKDGGECFYNFYLNLTKKSYDRFSVNGDG